MGGESVVLGVNAICAPLMSNSFSFSIIVLTAMSYSIEFSKQGKERQCVVIY
jgi:hypothetical protein